MLSSIYILTSTIIFSLSSALPFPQDLAELPSNTEVGSSGIYTELGGATVTVITPKNAKPQILNVNVGDTGLFTEIGQGETVDPDQALNVAVGDGGIFTELGQGTASVVLDS